MIVAELKGKIPSKLDNKEDILTSNVFSFFKYSNREFFKEYLLILGINVTLEDSQKAEFHFWKRFEDRTESDLVVICGRFYLLFEAKLYSDFSKKTKNIEFQIEREIRMGEMAAKNLNKEFIYIALTAEYFKKKIKYAKYENQDYIFIWTNWQLIAHFINKKLEIGDVKNNYEFMYDISYLFGKKNLRSFNGLRNLDFKGKMVFHNPIFYQIKTSKFKGEFFGFVENLTGFNYITKYTNFFEKTFFKTKNKFKFINNRIVFYNEKN